MSKRFFPAAFAVGLASVAWVAASFVGASWMAVAMTVLIAGVYLLGAWELRQFRAATSALDAALTAIPQPLADLRAWLEQVPASLRQAVRLRIEGERAALPGPALTPYLVGLLVMLGMLGTFLGMVVTFKGAVFALQGSTDLQAIRSALAEPIKGLGLSFGTSVAGVAASAMLGLMAAIARRERMEVVRHLDGRIAGVLQPFSHAHQRQETFRALQAQSTALPAVVDKLEALMERIEQRSRQLDERLSERQAQFHREVTTAYTDLARSVGTSLQDSLSSSAEAAGRSITPVVEQAMARIVAESQAVQARMGDAVKTQVDALSKVFEERSAALLKNLGEQSGAQQQSLAKLLAQSQELLRSRAETEAQWLAQQRERMDGLAGVWREELAALRTEESQRGQAAVDRLGELQAEVAQHLATLGAALEAPITRLLHTASEVPQAAAGVIAQLREEMQRVGERDNLALQERTELLERLGTLLQAVNQATGEQRTAIEGMVASASSVLEQAGVRFASALDAQASQAGEMGAQVTATAAELTKLAEGFGSGVDTFQASSNKLMETLQRIESSLEKSTTRSDEQLAYYVAQAREVIDLSIASQQGIVENLRELQARPTPPVALVAGARA
jgi:hypothetical protein